MKRIAYLSLVFSFCLAVGSTPALATGDCSDYTDLSGMDLPILVTGTTSGASADYGPFTEQPSCWEGEWDANCAYSSDVTYKWTAPHGGRFSFTLYESSSNADLLLYQFTCPAEPTYPDDFICGSHRSTWNNRAAVRDVELAAGQEILVVVDGWLIWNGEFTLRIYDTTEPADLVGMYMDVHRFSGISAACLWEDDGRYCEGVGLADVAGDVPVGDNHLFLIASTAKTVAATAVMQLWEDDLIELDEPIDGYLAVRNPHFPETPITFRMLMSHVSSINDNWAILNSLREEGVDSPITPCEFVEGYLTPGGAYYSSSNFSTSVPGTAYSYSNVGVTLLGCLIERINPDSLTFEEYCRAKIFDPLGMPSSSYLLASIDPEDMVTHHYWDGQEYVALPHYTMPIYPAGFFRTNAEEMSRFLLAYMRGGELYGERILEAATIDTMLTVQYPDLAPNRGLIWRYYPELSTWGHDGGYDGVKSLMHFDREQGRGSIALSNSTGLGGSEDWYGIQEISMSLLRRAEVDYPLGIGLPDTDLNTQLIARLAPSFPNPFNPRTTIRCEILRRGHARLQVFDLRGRLVTTLLDEVVESGPREVNWTGRDDMGREQPSGVYLSRLEVGGQVVSRRMTLVR